jgi:hypothetical protein
VDDPVSAAACKHCTGYMRHDLCPLIFLESSSTDIFVLKEVLHAQQNEHEVNGMLW